MRASLLLALALLAASWVSIFVNEDADLGQLFSIDTARDGWDFLAEMLGLRNAPPTPAFLDGGRWWEVLQLAKDTLAMSVLAAGLAGFAALATVALGARPEGAGPATRERRWLRWGVLAVVRAAYLFSRGVPELVWALLIVFVFAPGILAGALALAIHNFGILGKLAAEILEDQDPRPARALRSSGAGALQVLGYATLPLALPQFITYLLYRWEVIMRTTIVVGFVAASGLGREFQLSMSFFRLTDVSLILLVYFFLVLGGDWASAGLRRLAR